MLPHLCLTFWGLSIELYYCSVSCQACLVLWDSEDPPPMDSKHENSISFKSKAAQWELHRIELPKMEKNEAQLFFPDGFTLIPIIVHLIAVQFISGFKNEERFQCYTNFSRLNFSPIWKMVMKICRCPKSVGDGNSSGAEERAEAAILFTK